VLIVRACAVHRIHPDDARLDQLTEAFIAAYAQDISSRSKPWPGVIAALEKLASMGALLCVCTNKRTGLSTQLLDDLGMTHHFKAVIGADSVPRKKPDPGHSVADVGSAKAAGAPVALVSFGYTDTAPELLGADAVFTHYDDLPDLTVSLLRR
jgi:phosphoglycolate phosphatase